MAQFDVFRNPSVAQAQGFPYFVVIQSDQLDHLPTRLVMPLQRLSATPPANVPRRLALTVEVEGERFFLASHQCAPWPARLLKKPVANVTAQADALRDALDAVISGV
ncbi:CcdB family protein [Ramlibacter tataouinensis]|uniref:Toxin CcdB n=1 Tax=Ramlibacter tataouinensis (strain ATCC BAA-407 / DSM 14655 / LMG 21543 / TTB310) TaxID=365046 RepID=F5XWT0_RAMTT|nr:CcdB family protein [Ramlibacter tataouinensis]AEG94224.1 cytotoxic protein ccdB (LetB protein)-like protein [Ramlibacter tataouinensis TTB310]